MNSSDNNNFSLELPEDYREIMKEDLGENFDKYIEALGQKPVRGLRVNTKKIEIAKFLNETSLPLNKLPFVSDGFLLASEEKVGNFPEHLSGLIYLQEPSSMIAVASSGIEKENRPLKVLDLCAAPGGKTGQIANIVGNDSIIFSNEIIKARADVLFSNIERQGFKNIVILNEEPSALEYFKGFFDYVFVDAPCSGEGMFRKNPETIKEWNLGNVNLCSKRQKDILTEAEKYVCAGGKLIYSTCTFSKEEDEEITEWFLNNFNYEIQDVPNEVKNVTVPSSAKIQNADFARKFYPFSGDGEGQFVAVFKNTDGERETNMHKKKHFKNVEIIGRCDCNLVTEFMNKNMTETYKYNRICEMGKTVYLIPSAFDEKMQTAIDYLKIISIGVKMGTIEKGRFEPNHNIFMALEDLFIRKIEIDEDDLKKYMHGEELQNKTGISDGYAVITYKGNAVGGVKVIKQRLKNLYPRGLRV